MNAAVIVAMMAAAARNYPKRELRHVPIGTCRVCRRDVFEDQQEWGYPQDADFLTMAKALERDPVCSGECASLVSALEFG